MLVLDDQARPAELQQCRPRGEARFSIGVRRGALIRVHDSILMPGVSSALNYFNLMRNIQCFLQ